MTWVPRLTSTKDSISSKMMNKLLKKKKRKMILTRVSKLQQRNPKKKKRLMKQIKILEKTLSKTIKPQQKKILSITPKKSPATKMITCRLYLCLMRT